MNALIALFGTGLIALFSAFAKKSQLVITVVVTGLLIATGLLICQWDYTGPHSFNGLRFDRYAIAFSTITLLITLLVCLLAYDRYKHLTEHIGDYYGLLLFACCGALCLFSFTDLFMLFLGIEILSIPLYVLAGSKKGDLRSNEAALKYFLMGSFATGVLLFGIALIYGSTGSFELDTIRTTMATYDTVPVMFYIGTALVLVAMCFKVGAVPFHFWSPDVYTGSPTIITSFMATVVKIAAFGAFLKLFLTCFGAAGNELIPTLAVIAAATMTLANVTAVYQNNFKRLLAYSSVSHVGYILMAIIAMNDASVFNLLFYLASYALSTLLIFTIYMRVKEQAQDESIGVFKGLGKTNPAMAFAMVVGVLSLAGIPPTAGFFGKYFLFSNVFSAYPWLVIVAVINSAISIYYYFRVIILMYFTETAEGEGLQRLPVNVINTLVLTICIAGILSLGLLSGCFEACLTGF